MRKPKSAWTPDPRARASSPSVPEPEESTNEEDLREDDAEGRDAKVLRACYDRERRDWQRTRGDKDTTYVSPGVYRGKKAVMLEGGVVLDKPRPSTWLKLVRFFAQMKIPGETFIAVIFSRLDPEERIPEPDQLRSEKMLQRWAAAKDKIVEDLALALTLQQKLAETNWAVQKHLGRSAEEAWGVVLTDDQIGLSALFRYAVAKKLGKDFAAVAKAYRSEAILQYSRYRTIYGRTWNEILPEGFDGLASRLFPSLREADAGG